MFCCSVLFYIWRDSSMYKQSFVYGLFNDTVSNSDRKALYICIMSEINGKGCGRKRSARDLC